MELTTKFYESLFGSSLSSTDKRTVFVRFGMGELSWISYGVNPLGVDHFCVSVEDYEPDAVTEN
jgi:hypothetical protein